MVGSMKQSRENGLGGARAKVDTGQPTLFTYRIVEEYDHDPNAFTQGFEVLRRCNGSGKECKTSFIESTGLNRKSTVREVDIETGEVVRSTQLPAEDFGEGITRLGNTLYQLTWRSPKIFVYDVDNFDHQKMRKVCVWS
jgi:glutamine cyclotransferase